MNTTPRKNFPIALCALAISTLGFFSACAASVNTVENADAGTNKQLLSDKRIHTDSGTSDIAEPIEIRTSTTPSGTMRIQVEFMNRTRDIGRVFYSIEWFDENGMKIETPQTWIPLIIPPAKMESLTAVAPNNSAKDFRLSLIRRED